MGLKRLFATAQPLSLLMASKASNSRKMAEGLEPKVDVGTVVGLFSKVLLHQRVNGSELL